MNPHRRTRRTALAAFLTSTLAPFEWASAREQVRCIGYLSGGALPSDGLAKLLEQLGWIEGKNLRYEIRMAVDDPPSLAHLAAELVRAKVDVLLTFQSQRVAALAAATRTIPIVCGGAPDPVGWGFAKSLRRPGLNITGLSLGVPEQAEIQIGLLQAVRPRLERIIGLGRSMEIASRSAQSLAVAARSKGLAWDIVAVDSFADLERAFAPLHSQTGAVFSIAIRLPGTQVAQSAIRHRLAMVGMAREGGLMDYELYHADPAARIASIIDRILRGGNPAEIPFELPDRSRFILNRTTAKAIGVDVTPDLAMRATEIID